MITNFGAWANWASGLHKKFVEFYEKGKIACALCRTGVVERHRGKSGPVWQGYPVKKQRCLGKSEVERCQVTGKELCLAGTLFQSAAGKYGVDQLWAPEEGSCGGCWWCC